MPNLIVVIGAGLIGQAIVIFEPGAAPLSTPTRWARP
jgi:hypothetical protein